MARQQECWPEGQCTVNDAFEYRKSVSLECEKCCLSCPQIFMVKPEEFPDQPVKSNDLS